MLRPLVKLVADEDCTFVVRTYFHSQSVFFTTSICFAEALGVLKGKYVRGELAQEQYLCATSELMSIVRDENLQVLDSGIADRSVFEGVEVLMKRHSLDVSDAYQLVTLARPDFSTLFKDAPILLVSADKALVKAARSERFSAWNCIREAAP